MWSMLYPILIIVLSNVLYNVCTKSTPSEVNAFATLSITYLVAAAVSFAAFLISSKGKNIFSELSKTNWTTFVLGIVIVGLELGYILAYRNGWAMNTASVTANITLAVALVFVSLVFYKESITIKQIAGIVLCGGGLVLISIK
ncbi:MAG: EamA family transporter [Clostridia bacterium]|nr:EamA family transporter [Clostridia bacterium]